MNQTTTIRNGTDVVSFLKDQHARIRGLFAKVEASSGKEREESFRALRRLLAVHETAEEEIVHPAAKSALPNGESIVAARLREENEAKQVLAELEKLDLASVEFQTRFASFKGAAFAHAEAEEREEFEKLSDKLDPKRLERMRKAVEIAESVAPTRPHPGIESAMANMLVGPFAAMIDRARDAIAAKN
jgi:hemerythrin superfamily protein